MTRQRTGARKLLKVQKWSLEILLEKVDKTCFFGLFFRLFGLGLRAGTHSEGTPPKKSLLESKTFRAPPARGLVTALRVYML